MKQALEQGMTDGWEEYNDFKRGDVDTGKVTSRYLLNAPMLPQFAHDSEGGLTLYIQNESPGKAKEANWLPAPNRPFWMAMRLYWPKDEATSGEWAAPPVKRVL